MAIYAVEKNINDYKLFENFKNIFLINKCSYFDNNLEVLTKEKLDEFEERFIINYIGGSDLNFLEKSSR